MITICINDYKLIELLHKETPDIAFKDVLQSPKSGHACNVILQMVYLFLRLSSLLLFIWGLGCNLD